jgi:uroporphyrinogen-III synthase
MLDPALLRSRPVFVPHARIAEAARAKGVKEVLVAGASDAEMLEALVAYFRSHG